jgi:DNA-binding GntR family transcriptional regulator
VNRPGDQQLGISRVAAPLRMQVVEALRRQITEGRFKPGERLTERTLCDLAGVSRTIVREALRQLESEGLVEVIANRGPVVRRIGLQEAREIYEVRQALESLACRLFAERAPEPRRAEVRRILGDIEASAAGGDLDAVLRHKNRMYDVIAEHCGNDTLNTVLQPVLARINLLRTRSVAMPGRIGQTVREVRMMVDAMTRGDGPAAERAAALHVANACTAAMTALQQDTEA